jgi:hypothetical protein
MLKNPTFLLRCEAAFSSASAMIPSASRFGKRFIGECRTGNRFAAPSMREPAKKFIVRSSWIVAGRIQVFGD